jgi:magnesium transporter
MEQLSGAAAVRFIGMSFNLSEFSVHRFTFEELDHELEDAKVFTWIDVQAPQISTFNDLLRRAGIDLSLVNHFDAPEVLPRLVERPDGIAFYLHEIVDPERHLDLSRGLTRIQWAPMILAVGHRCVLTYHRRPLHAVDAVHDTAKESFRLAGESPGFIAFLFLQRCLHDYAHLNLANDNCFDTLEGASASMKHEELSEKITLAGSNLLTLKKLAASLHIVLMEVVTKRSPFIGGEARSRFAELLQNVTSIRAAIDSSRDVLDGIVGNMHERAAHKTSNIARVLTLVSAIILPLTLITGIYGMNFDRMPELRWKSAYFVILGLMGGLAVGLLLLFYRMGWIGPKADR